MKKIVRIIFYVIILCMVCLNVHSETISLCKIMVDDTTNLVLSDCMNKKPNNIGRFCVCVNHRGNKKFINITGYEKKEIFDKFEYCGYLDVKDCIFLFFGDYKDWMIDYSEQKTFKVLYRLPEVGGTPYSWTYCVTNGEIIYLGNLDSE